MRFMRRFEGIRSARIIFKRARDDTRSSYHIYVAAAFMEYFCTKVKLKNLKTNRIVVWNLFIYFL